MKSRARKEKELYAEERSAYWLSEGNSYSEKGYPQRAEECYEKSARWLMRANDLRENVAGRKKQD